MAVEIAKLTKSPSAQWLDRHLSLVIAFATTSVVISKVMFTVYSVEAALALVRATPPTSLLFGLLLSTVPLLMLAASAFAVGGIIGVGRAAEPLGWRYTVPSAALLFAAVMIAPVFAVGLMLVYAFLGGGIWWLMERRSDPDPSPAHSEAFLRKLEAYERKTRTRNGLIIGFGLAGGLIAAFAFTPVWMPTELVTVSGQEPSVAYVVEDEGRWTTLLGWDDRAIELVESNAVVGRHVCETASTDWAWLRQSFWQLGAPSTVPACPRPNPPS